MIPKAYGFMSMDMRWELADGKIPAEADSAKVFFILDLLVA